VPRPVLQSANPAEAGRIGDYAVVIPAYNERATIAGIVERALACAHTVIVVDDGSTDGTADALASCSVTLIRNDRNGGKGHSLWCGMQHALSLGMAGVVTLDGDGQHAPEDIPRLVAMARSHPRDIVVGARLLGRECAPRSRRCANRVADFWIGWAAGQRLADSQSGFRVYPSTLLERVRIRHDAARSFVFESEFLIAAARLDARVRNVPVATIYPHHARASHFRGLRDITRITRMVAWHILRRGFHPAGLYRSVFSRDEALSVNGVR
jgi:glycosyltransferase involved in cell wall biosynthesis